MAASVSTISLVLLRGLAVNIKLVDVPCERKSHNGHVPLVGGVATLFGVIAVAIAQSGSSFYQMEYIVFSCILVLVGLIDDKLDISATFRLIILMLLSTWLVEKEGLSLSYLGDLFGTGNIYLSQGALAFTTIAVIGCVTAFNMVDGIDGLLGMLAACTIASLGLLFYLSGQHTLALFCLTFIAAMCPYVAFNLGLKVKSKYKVFMGDSGSFLVGFTIIWLLVFATQNINGYSSHLAMRPVTALWIIAIPLMDMALVMIKRVLKKQSPLKADRTHIHHVLMLAGNSPRKTLFIVTALACALASIGLIAEVNQVEESKMFAAFLQVFVVYGIANIVLEKRAKQKSANYMG
ncbi:UDP-N-acetylglucosamine--undecaprenyl-phosphate N-acetylglucosaminephosphotransferase [Vibrio sp. SCSIO 43135]|uniref:UDP-N-acetylglucosamine--undecaprenyl-phosphate N-acetylglucosaminephosphotransferase n=1 Tax=Vibrio sp. SCSIO 43135 TaxID=2819096 RepID=UPI002074C8CC|nr:UDP-N-acetylglucosamine--undecaprenyl-phosphate N-acetylglucosaminephosphotransferase [Vibrio sp. SCSIO 43135]USD41344.1 UDP-N-acetylglucosamine--undecaprenyl-phosphate N-acetylglucosaminephosphotransferase [Vibrio sp. SCSIO 43135]